MTKQQQNRLQEIFGLDKPVEGHQVDPTFVNALMAQVVEMEVKLKDQDEQIATLELDAMLDPLTGIANRRMFNNEMQRAISAVNRHKRQSALLLIDLNSFKVINDNLGHLIGDAVLQHVANTLKQNVRPTDIVARLGGDEFCIILNEVRSHIDVKSRAKFLTDIIAGSPCITELGQHVQTTVSIGCHTFLAGETMEEIMNKADADMYRIKGQGAALVAS